MTNQEKPYWQDVSQAILNQEAVVERIMWNLLNRVTSESADTKKEQLSIVLEAGRLAGCLEHLRAARSKLRHH